MDQHFEQHFSSVAPHYRDVRFTNHEPIEFIRQHFGGTASIKSIELGCGSGRYTQALLKILGQRLTVHCLDTSADMLSELDVNLKGKYQGQYDLVNGTVKEATFDPGGYDAVFSFNALHHFDLEATLHNITSWLRPNSMAFLYTRTPAQNKRNLWGRYFPDFSKKEDRLHSEDTLRATINKIEGLTCVEMKEFRHIRQTDLATVMNKTTNYHYSTLRYYGQGEFPLACDLFEHRLQEAYSDGEPITWHDTNLMVVVKKNPVQ